MADCDVFGLAIACLRRTVAAGAVVVALAGCSRDPRVECAGTVTFAGEPVEEGSIGFFPLAGESRSEGAVITAGRYRARVLPGRHRVEIRGSRVMQDFKGPSDLGPPREDYIPAQFNAQSTLEVDVAAPGPNDLPFDLRPQDGAAAPR